MSRDTGLTRQDHGAGAVLAVAVVGVLVAVLTLLLPLVAVAVDRQRGAALADAAALGAADTALGLAAGIPCDRAAQVVREGGGVLERCTQRADTVSVAVAVETVGVRVAVTARAGPPPVGGRAGAREKSRVR